MHTRHSASHDLPFAQILSSPRLDKREFQTNQSEGSAGSFPHGSVRVQYVIILTKKLDSGLISMVEYVDQEAQFRDGHADKEGQGVKV